MARVNEYRTSTLLYYDILKCDYSLIWTIVIIYILLTLLKKAVS
jgi:hypothetical protein